MLKLGSSTEHVECLHSGVVGRFLAAAFICLSGLLYVTIPPSPDQWFLDYTGWMMSQGAIPYETFADGNWPLCHWSHAASTTIFGRNQYSWRLFDFCVMILCTFAGADLLRQLYGRAAGRWMVCLYPPMYVCLGYWFAGERDVLGGNLGFVIAWCYWRGRISGVLKWQIAAGVLIAFIAMIKPTFALVGVALALNATIGVLVGNWRARDAIVQIAIAGVASVAGLAIGLLVLAMQGTSLADFWELAFVGVSQRLHSSGPSTADILQKAMVYAVSCWHWYLGFAVIGFAQSCCTGGRRGIEANTLCLMLWLAGLVSYLTQVLGLVYTMGSMYAAMMLYTCAGLGIVSEQASRQSDWRKYFLIAITGIAFLGGVKKFVGTFSGSLKYISGQLSPEEYLSQSIVGDRITTWEALVLTRELSMILPEDSTILVWGRSNAINYLSGRAQPTRFHHNVNLIGPAPPPLRILRKWNRQFRDELAEKVPEVCVVNRLELGSPYGGDTEASAFLAGFLETNYVPLFRVGDCVVYSHKNSQLHLKLRGISQKLPIVDTAV